MYDINVELRLKAQVICLVFYLQFSYDILDSSVLFVLLFVIKWRELCNEMKHINILIKWQEILSKKQEIMGTIRKRKAKM